MQGSQYAVGAAYYRGQGEVQRDGEEALAWLLRAAKNPNGDNRLIAAAAVSRVLSCGVFRVFDGVCVCSE